jgi:hypothetical protein
MLAAQRIVKIKVLPGAGGVKLPLDLMQQEEVVLQLGMDMALQIPDRFTSPDGVTGTLSFNRKCTYCVIPWRAIEMMWFDGEDRRYIFRDAEPTPNNPPPPLERPKVYPKLRLVK